MGSYSFNRLQLQLYHRSPIIHVVDMAQCEGVTRYLTSSSFAAVAATAATIVGGPVAVSVSTARARSHFD